jgi:hypothetical protein
MGIPYESYLFIISNKFTPRISKTITKCCPLGP